jgi:hypothetical protein
MTDRALARVQVRQSLAQAATWLAMLLPVFAWAPLTYPGYFVFHSAFLPIFNLNDLMGHLRDPAWAPLIGQPHDIWRAERALPYLFAAVPRLFGADSVTAVKFVFALSIFMGALGVYVWARGHLGAWAALLASLVYVLLPINLATVYVRGAFAEAVFLGLMPWVLAAARWSVDSRRLSAAASFALLIAACFWTEAGLAIWLSVICSGYLLIRRRYPPVATEFMMTRPRRYGGAPALLGLLGGCTLGLLGLIPVITRHGWGGSSRVTFAEHFVYPHQLMSSGWGFGSSVAGPYDTMPFQLGVAAFGLALFAIIDPASRSRIAADGTPDRARRATLYLATGLVLALMLLSSTLSMPLWRVLAPAAHTLTYPWQLLLLAGPWLALLAGMGGLALSARVGDVEGVPSVALYAGLLALVLAGSYAYLAPQTSDINPPKQPLAIFGEDEVALLRAAIAGEPGPGRVLTLDVEWQALRPMAEDYTVFVHAVGPDGVLWGQHDSMPRGGAAPTSGWQPGAVISDTIRLELRADAPPGPGYSYPLGLYLWQTGERLKTGAQDQFIVQP